MRTEKTREWAFWNHGAGQRNRQWPDRFLTQGEVQWIMHEEDNATLLTKCCPATGGKSPRSLIRQGQYITLGELFVFGAHRCSCWGLYRTYTSLDIFIRKIVSGSEEAVCLSNAKRNPHFETCKFGLGW